MKEITVKEDIIIENLIYEVRGQQVMLDSDLANLYKVETKRINEAVRRNLEKFPERFSWILTDDEWNFLRSQFATLEIKNTGRGEYRKYLPRVFTEQGVAMLATILKSKVATQISIKIMDAFVVMRKYISNNLIEFNYMKRQILNNSNSIDKNTKDIKLLQESFDKLQEKTKNNAIFFEGQIYDAYSLLLYILNKAKEKIIIIDNYAGKELLDILKDINIKIKIYSTNMNEVLIKKYQKEYDNVELIYNDKFHDRFIILDNIVLYHCGSSFKDLGKKCFAINKIDDNKILNGILERISDSN